MALIQMSEKEILAIAAQIEELWQQNAEAGDRVDSTSAIENIRGATGISQKGGQIRQSNPPFSR